MVQKLEYNFSTAKAHSIYAVACEHIDCMPKCNIAKLLVDQAVAQHRTSSTALTALKNELQTLASQLPEYSVAMGMFGVRDTLESQLMVEIGDVCRFYSKKALIAYAGIHLPRNNK